MRITIILLILFLSCNKTVPIVLPHYQPELVVEMYLEDARRLKCYVSESLEYASDSLSRSVNNALVMISNGTETDTLRPSSYYDYESGRKYNYTLPGIFFVDSALTYSLLIKDSTGRTIKGTTRMSQDIVSIDSIGYEKVKSDNHGRYAVAFAMEDPEDEENFYRVIIGKGVNDYTGSHTDFCVSDAAFNGKRYRFISEPGYQKNDTVTIRIYSLLKDHFEYLQTTEGARTANFNPFMQPVRIKSNVEGGLGIFAAVRYDQRRIIIR